MVSLVCRDITTLPTLVFLSRLSLWLVEVCYCTCSRVYLSSNPEVGILRVDLSAHRLLGDH